MHVFSLAKFHAAGHILSYLSLQPCAVVYNHLLWIVIHLVLKNAFEG